MTRFANWFVVFCAFLPACKPRNTQTPDSSLASAAKAKTATPIVDGAPNEITYKNAKYLKSSTLKIIDFGKIKVDSKTGISDFLDFVIPKDTLGFSIHLTQPGLKDYVYTYSLVDSKGTEIISPSPTGVKDSVLKSLGGRGQKISQNATLEDTFKGFSSTPVPNGQNVAVPEGVWRLRIAIENPTLAGNIFEVHGAIVLKCKDGGINDSDVGHLALKLNVTDNYEFATLKQLTPKAPNPLPAILNDVGKIFESAGIQLEVAEVKRLETRFDKAELSPSDETPNAEFMELMTKYAGNAVPAVPVFMIKPSSSVIYAGIASYGALAAGYVPFEKFSGVIVQENIQTSKKSVLGHELGHALGLYHTNMDNLPDTFALDHYIEGDQITPMKGDFRQNLNNANNLMIDGSHGEHLSMTESQKRIIRLHPFVSIYSKK